jgi:lipoprotein-anchoring transpeptidase ErfK/SrfK
MTHLRPGTASRAIAVAIAATMALAACVNADAGDGPPPVPSSAARIDVKPAGTDDWDTSRPIVVAARDGVLTEVDVRDRRGKRVPGRFAAGKTRWESTLPVLAYDARYTVRSRAVDDAGIGTRDTTRFRTVDPKKKVYTGITPYGNPVVGVGMPIIVTYDQPVTRRAEAERRLSVTTTPKTVGSWHWVGDQMVRWRPKTYWRPGTDVVVRSNTVGVRLGEDTWGNDFDRATFSIGESQVSTVDIANHTMTVRRNGQVVRTIPVTTGKPGWDTRNGVKVIISKDREVVMDAASIDVDEGDPEYYRLDVEYAMRITWSGEYLHAAPWSVSSQGDENVSHGCTGMSDEAASWFYNNSKIGDVVNYVNGNRSMEPWNGYTDWTVSWQDWQAGSALN